MRLLCVVVSAACIVLLGACGGGETATAPQGAAPATVSTGVAVSAPTHSAVPPLAAATQQAAGAASVTPVPSSSTSTGATADATPARSTAARAVLASIDSANAAAQAGDLAKAKAAFQPVAQQWAAIPDDGTQIPTGFYAPITQGITAMSTFLADPSTDAASAASALGDMQEEVTALLSPNTAAVAATTVALAPQMQAAGDALNAAAATATERGKAACALITQDEASAALGGTATVLPEANALSSMLGVGIAAPNEAVCQYSYAAPDTSKSLGGVLLLHYVPSGGGAWFAQAKPSAGSQPASESGKGVGDQYFLLGAGAYIYVLKGDRAFSIATMPAGMPGMKGLSHDQLKTLAKKAASRLP